MNAAGTQRAGAVGFQWVTVTAEVDTEVIGNGTNGTPGIATFKVTNPATGEMITIGTVDNSVDDNPDDDGDGTPCNGGDDICTNEMPVGMGGGIGLMTIDFFSSGPENVEFNFTLYDNLVISEGISGNVPDGDFNDDDAYDCADVDALVVEMVAGTNNPDFDLTDDGNVNGDDLTEWLAQGGAANPGMTSGGNSFLVGDADLSGAVDGNDFLVWNANKFTTTAAYCSGDFNGDGAVDGNDFLLWNSNKFTAADVFGGAGTSFWNVGLPDGYQPAGIPSRSIVVRSVKSMN